MILILAIEIFSAGSSHGWGRLRALVGVGRPGPYRRRRESDISS